MPNDERSLPFAFDLENPGFSYSPLQSSQIWTNILRQIARLPRSTTRCKRFIPTPPYDKSAEIFLIFSPMRGFKREIDFNRPSIELLFRNPNASSARKNKQITLHASAMISPKKGLPEFEIGSKGCHLFLASNIFDT